jgi:hypothetical protein
VARAVVQHGALPPGARHYASLPGWARATLEAHQADRRAELFTRDELEAGATYDALWNATQGQLRTDGRIHNYLRILWGKKFLEWTRSGEEALDFMLHVNNRWALDGRNPNSTSGITWVMGRYDHAWQERPVLGKVRPMSSAATARKIRVDGYVARYAAALPGGARREGVGDKRGDAPAPAGERKVARDRGPARGAGTAGFDVLPEGVGRHGERRTATPSTVRAGPRRPPASPGCGRTAHPRRARPPLARRPPPPVPRRRPPPRVEQRRVQLHVPLHVRVLLEQRPLPPGERLDAHRHPPPA